MLVKAIQKFPSLKDLIPSLNQNKIYIYPNLNGIGLGLFIFFSLGKLITSALNKFFFLSIAVSMYLCSSELINNYSIIKISKVFSTNVLIKLG